MSGYLLFVSVHDFAEINPSKAANMGLIMDAALRKNLARQTTGIFYCVGE